VIGVSAEPRVETATSNEVTDAREPGCSMGSKTPVRVMVRTAGRAYGTIGEANQEGYSGEESRLAVTDGCSTTASRARSERFCQSRAALAAADGQAVRPLFPLLTHQNCDILAGSLCSVTSCNGCTSRIRTYGTHRIGGRSCSVWSNQHRAIKLQSSKR